MWKILYLMIVTLVVGDTYQRAPVLLSNITYSNNTSQLSQSQYSSYINWRQNITGIISNLEEPAATKPTITSIDKNTCPQCFCGVVGPTPYIVGGNSTYKNQYPWMALLTYDDDFYCGGTLINNKYVLTAAHCVYGFVGKKIGVRLLEHDRNNNEDTNRIDFKVLRVIKHEEFNPTSLNNDIALLRLDTDGVEIGQNTGLHPVCMPAKEESYSGFYGIATGWGDTKQGGSLSPVLNEVRVPIISNDDCRKTKHDEESITDNMMCAGYPEGRMDSCQSDSGGPLQIFNNSTYHIVGVISWGEGCAQPDFPGVYARVNKYLNWIHNNTLDACPCTNT